MKGETREEMAVLIKTANRRKVKKKIELLRGNAIGERLFSPSYCVFADERRRWLARNLKGMQCNLLGKNFIT